MSNKRNLKCSWAVVQDTPRSCLPKIMHLICTFIESVCIALEYDGLLEFSERGGFTLKRFVFGLPAEEKVLLPQHPSLPPAHSVEGV